MASQLNAESIKLLVTYKPAIYNATEGKAIVGSCLTDVCCIDLTVQ
jgi:hypothetical protein